MHEIELSEQLEGLLRLAPLGEPVSMAAAWTYLAREQVREVREAEGRRAATPVRGGRGVAAASSGLWSARQDREKNE